MPRRSPSPLSPGAGCPLSLTDLRLKKASEPQVCVSAAPSTRASAARARTRDRAPAPGSTATPSSPRAGPPTTLCQSHCPWSEPGPPPPHSTRNDSGGRVAQLRKSLTIACLPPSVGAQQRSQPRSPTSIHVRCNAAHLDPRPTTTRAQPQAPESRSRPDGPPRDPGSAVPPWPARQSKQLPCGPIHPDITSPSARAARARQPPQRRDPRHQSAQSARGSRSSACPHPPRS